MSISAARVRAALAEVRVAERRRDETIEQEFPVGTYVRWERHGRLQRGTVERVSGERLEVHNEVTDKTYWIYVTDLYGCARYREDEYESEAA